MKTNVERLRLKLRAARRWNRRGGRGYFCRQNKGLAKTSGLDELTVMRARNAARWAELERAAMTGILQGQRELGRLAA